MAAVFVIAGWPVWTLTRPAVELAAPDPSPAPTAQTGDATATVPLAIEASFAPAPVDFQVRCLDQTVLEGHGPARQFSTRWQTTLPKEGIDLVVRANWAADTSAGAGPTAARLTVQLADGTKIDKSFWTAPGQSLAEVITVPGAP